MILKGFHSLTLFKKKKIWFIYSIKIMQVSILWPIACIHVHAFFTFQTIACEYVQRIQLDGHC